MILVNPYKLKNIIKNNFIKKYINTSSHNQIKKDKINLWGSNNVTGIVPYGTNLGPIFKKGRLTKNLKKLIFLNSKSYSIIVGKLLSDGWLEKTSAYSNTKFRFKQSIIRCNYVIYSWMNLIHYSSNTPIIVKSFQKGKFNYGLEFCTRYLPCFNELYNLFYKNNKKIIPYCIYDLLTPIALTHWIMGDGAILNKGLVLCTDSFTLLEVINLCYVLKIKFYINTTIQGWKNNKPRIYILEESMPKVINLTKSNMLPSMLYKLHIKNNV